MRRLSSNVGKCNVLSVTRSRRPTLYSYTLHDGIVDRLYGSTYLGVKMTSTLSWTPHIDICNRGNKILCLLWRNLHSAPVRFKINTNTALVRPHLAYCSTVWDPYIVSDVYKLDMVQRRAVRHVFNKYHYS